MNTHKRTCFVGESIDAKELFKYAVEEIANDATYWNNEIIDYKDLPKGLIKRRVILPNSVQWCSGYHYCTTSFIKAWTQVLHRFKSCLWRVGDSRWWGSRTVVPAGNKATTILQKQFIIISISGNMQTSILETIYITVTKSKMSTKK